MFPAGFGRRRALSQLSSLNVRDAARCCIRRMCQFEIGRSCRLGKCGHSRREDQHSRMGAALRWERHAGHWRPRARMFGSRRSDAGYDEGPCPPHAGPMGAGARSHGGGLRWAQGERRGARVGVRSRAPGRGATAATPVGLRPRKGGGSTARFEIIRCW